MNRGVPNAPHHLRLFCADKRPDRTHATAARRRQSDVLERELPEGPDKTYLIRKLREVAMWAIVCVTRLPDGTPRDAVKAADLIA